MATTKRNRQDLTTRHSQADAKRHAKLVGQIQSLTWLVKDLGKRVTSLERTRQKAHYVSGDN